MRRRALLVSLATGSAAVAGCATTIGSGPDHSSTVPDNDTTTDGVADDAADVGPISYRGNVYAVSGTIESR